MQGPSEFLYVDWMFIQYKFNDLVQEGHVWDVSCHPLSQPVKFLDTRDRAGYVFPRVGLRRQRKSALVTLQNTYLKSSQVTRISTVLYLIVSKYVHEYLYCNTMKRIQLNSFRSHYMTLNPHQVKNLQT